jgi:hypothetical protein
MADFTSSESFMDLSKLEKQIADMLFPDAHSHDEEPSANSVKNLIAYSQALSVRKSKHLRHVRLTLN